MKKLPMRQNGAVLMAMLAVLILGAAWWAVTALSTPINRTASERVHNARILQEAKSALIGYVAQQAALTGEENPGRLPCPEAFGSIGGINEGRANGNCTLPAVGRLPWRTLGIDKWRDVANEPLWYVVSPAWALSNSTSPALTTYINSNTTGQLTLDGTADVVALIIAPGRALQVSASPGCTARIQRRTTPSPSIDLRDYLECGNATSPADAAFQSTGPDGSFNDHVLAITGAEILPAIEAAIASRFERQIAPTLRTVYSGGDWPANPVLPFAATFADPATSGFKGAAATFGGLMPVGFSETAPQSGIACNPATDGARCDPTFVAWTGASMSGGQVRSPDCSATTATTINCTYHRRCNPVLLLFCNPGNVNFTLTATAANVGMAFRELNSAVTMGNILVTGRNVSGVINSDGSATITLTGTAQGSGGDGIAGLLGDTLCGVLGVALVCKAETISVPIRLLADHPVLDPANTSYNWFFRNNWHQVSWYAVAPDIAPSGPRSCGASCLTVNFRTPSTGQRGLLAIAGRNLTGRNWPDAATTVTDWLESTNNDANLTYAVRDPALMIRRTFNDRIAIIDP
jgi:hypothetical protein